MRGGVQHRDRHRPLPTTGVGVARSSVCSGVKAVTRSDLGGGGTIGVGCVVTVASRAGAHLWGKVSDGDGAEEAAGVDGGREGKNRNEASDIVLLLRPLLLGADAYEVVLPAAGRRSPARVGGEHAAQVIRHCLCLK